MREFDLIGRLLRPLARQAKESLGLEDDAAVLAVAPDRELVATLDMMAAGRHYLDGDDPALVARKLVRVNLSDLAAMGATARGILLGYAARGDLDEDAARRFVEGLGRDLEHFSLALLGGDTISQARGEVFSLTALGEVPKGEALRRCGARAGDLLYLSGTLGDAPLGLAALKGELARREAWIERFYLPSPRLSLGQRVRPIAHAAIDVSDGLVADAGHMARTSGVRLVIDRARLPLSADTCRLLAEQPEWWTRVLTGGDDYELLLAVPPEGRDDLMRAAQAARTPLAWIGRVEAGEGVTVRDEAGRALSFAHPGFVH
ncbi:MAG: thiamine-phosphate kinase [Alphaproteobacteria bacterium]|nr:MAG: thiamine-phosphate kinase [Alphaproteobacteria bacterium]